MLFGPSDQVVVFIALIYVQCSLSPIVWFKFVIWCYKKTRWRVLIDGWALFLIGGVDVWILPQLGYPSSPYCTDLPATDGSGQTLISYLIFWLHFCTEAVATCRPSWKFSKTKLDRIFLSVSTTCDKCKSDDGTLGHLFWSCPKLRTFWDNSWSTTVFW